MLSQKSPWSVHSTPRSQSFSLNKSLMNSRETFNSTRNVQTLKKNSTALDPIYVVRWILLLVKLVRAGSSRRHFFSAGLWRKSYLRVSFFLQEGLGARFRAPGVKLERHFACLAHSPCLSYLSWMTKNIENEISSFQNQEWRLFLYRKIIESVRNLK